jgi:hypothetical protein
MSPRRNGQRRSSRQPSSEKREARRESTPDSCSHRGWVRAWNGPRDKWAHGRCGPCHDYWKEHGAERPLRREATVTTT